MLHRDTTRGSANFLLPQQIREVRASASREGMPTPRSGIDIQNLVSAISWIEFEFDLDHSIELNALQESPTFSLDDSLPRRLDKRARVAELDGILSSALRNKRRVRSSLLAYRTKGELILSVARNAFLDQDFLRRFGVDQESVSQLKMLGVFSLALEFLLLSAPEFYGDGTVGASKNRLVARHDR